MTAARTVWTERIASSMWTVPITLVANVSTGDSYDARTSD